jgi:predicted amidohydrolase YtcJ
MVTSVAPADSGHRRVRKSTAEDVDSSGLFLLPGFEDAHVHAEQAATRRRRLDLSSATSATHAAAMVATAHQSSIANGAASSEVLVGHGFRAALWADEPATELLDEAVPDRPVLLQSNDLHVAWLNSAALRLLDRDPRSSGVLRERDCFSAVAELTRPPISRSDRWVSELTAAAAARGVTKLIDFEFADTITDWTRRARTQHMATRVVCVVPKHLLDEVADRGLRTGDLLPDCGGLLEVGPLKLFVDGSLNSGTAHCHHPYAGTNEHGMSELSEEELAHLVRQGKRYGLMPAVHAIGDAAVTTALNVLEAVNCPGRIEHAQLIAQADFRRFGREGLLVGVQPAHAPDDRDIADALWAGHTHRAFAYADLLAAGAQLRIGSDAPNAPLDPWDGVAAAVARSDDDRPPWHPEQSIPLAAALAAASGGRSSVEVGSQADLVLLEHDPWTLSPSDLREMPVWGTLCAGEWTHRQSR